MSIYERFGVRPIINAVGVATRYGGSLMEPAARQAMEEAARYSVRLDELQAAASKVISKKTHAEAGIVTSGTAAALTLAAAACIAGLDVARMNRLPDTTGMPNEVIMPWHQISGYDHAIRAAGARLIGVGIPNDTTPPDEVYTISREDVETAITPATVAIAYAPRPGSHPPLGEVIDIGKKYHLPVIIDAANQVPPVENLHRFIDMDADLVCFSGGKGICGYQASGILCGRRELVASAALQMLDMVGIAFGEWDPPASLIPKEKLRGRPEHGIGRGMKVSKEAIIGLLVALENLTEENFARKSEHLRQLLEIIQTRLEDVSGLRMRITPDPNSAYPLLELKIDQEVVGKSAYEVVARLMEGEPRIYLRGRYLHKGLIFVFPLNLDEETARIIGEHLHAVLKG